MAKLKLSILTGDYDIIRPLRDGSVQPEGIELEFASYPGTGAIHDLVAAGKGCDVNEYNGAHYVVQKARGRNDITAIPVFLHRRFRHGFVFVNTSKGITQPADLAGRRVACEGFGAAASYWIRGFLGDYGAPHRSITWVAERLDEASRNARPDLKLEIASEGESVEEMLLTGEVDAIVQPNITPTMPRVTRGSSGCGRTTRTRRSLATNGLASSRSCTSRPFRRQWSRNIHG